MGSVRRYPFQEIDVYPSTSLNFGSEWYDTTGYARAEFFLWWDPGPVGQVQLHGTANPLVGAVSLPLASGDGYFGEGPTIVNTGSVGRTIIVVSNPVSQLRVYFAADPTSAGIVRVLATFSRY